MAKLEALTKTGGERSLAHQLGKVADNIRQSVATRLGVRPYRVFLIHTRWTGEERGEGEEEVVVEREILPTPRVEDVSTVVDQPYEAGVRARGPVRIDRISVDLFNEDDLCGESDGRRIEDNEGFYYEIVEDGRGAKFTPSKAAPARRRYRFVSANRNADAAEWVVMVERMDEDRDRDGFPGSRYRVEGP